MRPSQGDESISPPLSIEDDDDDDAAAAGRRRESEISPLPLNVKLAPMRTQSATTVQQQPPPPPAYHQRSHHPHFSYTRGSGRVPISDSPPMHEFLQILEEHPPPPPSSAHPPGDSRTGRARLEALEARISALLTQHGANSTPAAEFAREVVDQLRKGVSFTANVAGGALRLNELKGVPQAPTVSREALDMSTAAVKILDTELVGRRNTGRLAEAFNRMLTTRPPLHPETGAAATAVESPPLDYTTVAVTTPKLTPLPPPSLGSPSSEESEATEDRSLLLSRVSAEAQRLKDRLRVAVEMAPPVVPSSLPPPRRSDSDWAVSLESPVLERFTLMTFNAGLLEYRLAGVNCYSNPPFTKRRLYQLPLHLKAFAADVVCLQEVYDDWQANFLAAALHATFPFVARRRSGGAFALHNGLMVLSRFPILRIEFHPFHAVTAIERYFGSKGMLECTVEVPTVGRVSVVNIHLASGAVDPESKALEGVRNKELQQAIEVSRAAVARGEHPIIIGDLNAAPNLCPSNYECLLENGFCDGFLMAVCRERHPSPQQDLAHLGSLREEEEIAGGKSRLRHAQSLIKPPNGRPTHRRRWTNSLTSPRHSPATATASTGWNEEDQGGEDDDDVDEEKEEEEEVTGGPQGASDFCAHHAADPAHAAAAAAAGAATAARSAYADDEANDAAGCDYNQDQDEDDDDEHAVMITTMSTTENKKKSVKKCGGCTRPPYHQPLGRHATLPVLAESEGSSGGAAGARRKLKAFRWRKQPAKAIGAPAAVVAGAGGSGSKASSSNSSGRRQQSLQHKQLHAGRQPLLGSSDRRRSTLDGWTPLWRSASAADCDDANRRLSDFRPHRQPQNGNKSRPPSGQRSARTAGRGHSPFSPSRAPRRFLQLLKRAASGKLMDDEDEHIEDDDNEFELSTAAATTSNGKRSPRQPCCPGRCGGEGHHGNMKCGGAVPDRSLVNRISYPQIVNVDCDGELELTPVKVNLNHDPFCTALFTWDPKNPLNAIGPHSACHGLRCDHIFLPASSEMSPAGRNLLEEFRADDPRVLFTEPRVTVEGCCCGWLGRGQLITLSDHYGLAVTLLRRANSSGHDSKNGSA